MSRDRNVRTYAVPVRGTTWGLNYNERSEHDVGAINNAPTIMSDYHDFFPGSRFGQELLPELGIRKVCPIRILQPHYGGIAECYADLSISVASGDSDLSMKLAIGRMDPSSYERVMNYSSAEIDRSWRRMRGSDEPLTVSSGKIEADLVNLLPALPEYGDDDFVDDAFVLIVAFNKVPTISGSFKFHYLNIHTSVTGVV